MSKWKDRNGWMITEQLPLSHSLNPHKGLKIQLLTPGPSPHLLPKPGSQGGQHFLALMPRDTTSCQVQAQMWSHLKVFSLE